MGDPQDEDDQVEAVLDGTGSPDVREPDDGTGGFGGFGSDEHSDDDEDQDECEATQDARQATQSQHAPLLRQTYVAC